MDEETRDSKEETKDSRRNALKKVGKFVIPTIVTFHLSSLAVAASGTFQPFGDVKPGKQ